MGLSKRSSLSARATALFIDSTKAGLSLSL